MKLFSEKNLHTVFDAGIVIKTIDSVGQIILGLILIFVDGQVFTNIALAIFGDELKEAPLKNIWDFAVHSFSQLSNNSQAFLAFILISHGIVKLILVAGLIKNKLWVYPLAAIAFTGFGMYQIYQIIVAPSPFMVGLTILDAIFVMLIIHEYRYQKKYPKQPFKVL